MSGATFTLPWPPTSNTMFGLKGHRRFVSKRYQEWKDDAGALVMQQCGPTIIGPVRVEIALTPPNKRAYDLDNRVKPILDLLVAYQIIEEDNNRVVKEIAVREDLDSTVGAHVAISPLQFTITPEGRKALAEAEAQDLADIEGAAV